jgi:hypothetical protein
MVRIRIKDYYKVASFNVSKENLSFLANFVKFKRMQGETEFTQREALEEAFQLLRQKYPKIKSL